ncbi:MAG: methyltransferase domain-containing protein [Chloroflexota bacterium]
MTDHFKNIYNTQASQYERLIAREDQRGNIFQTIMEIHPFSGTTVVECGTGTGRLTRIMSVLVESIHSFDVAFHMLREGQRVLHETGMENWSFSQADNTALPVADNTADIVIEGWSFGHVMGWHPDDWQARVDAMLSEMQRVAKPDGTLILLETMGTGNRKPQPPNPELATLYQYWEEQHGFEYQWIRTDYQFESIEEADELIRFFFGDDMADELVAGKNIIVPECTGVWSKRV